MQCAVLIPAFKPSRFLPLIVDGLLNRGFPYVLIVNDGSGDDFADLFYRLRLKSCVQVIHHAQNRGKGAALRTGFRHIQRTHAPFSGVVTADADGQHLTKDVVKIGRCLDANPNALILGCRSFNRKVPFRCALGNKISRLVYLLLVGRYLKDTQTGLRGIPISLLPILTELTSMRFAYEMEVLLALQNRGIPVKEIPITAVYKKKNLNSHFRPLMDSYQISCILILWCLRERLLRLPRSFT